MRPRLAGCPVTLRAVAQKIVEPVGRPVISFLQMRVDLNKVHAS